VSRKEKQFDLNDVTLIDSERVEIGIEGEGSMGNRTRCEGFAPVCLRVGKGGCFSALRPQQKGNRFLFPPVLRFE
jgi:hypothetical protein